jgi:hypothetical protein
MSAGYQEYFDTNDGVILYTYEVEKKNNTCYKMKKKLFGLLSWWGFDLKMKWIFVILLPRLSKQLAVALCVFGFSRFILIPKK